MKGEYGAGCNRTACRAPGATFYNQSTRKFYCGRCAVVLNAANAVEAFRLFGSELCVPISHDAHPRHGAMRDERREASERAKNLVATCELFTASMSPVDELLAYIAAIEADRARLDYLEVAVPSGEFRDFCNALHNPWPGSVRELIDTAKAGV